MEPNPAVELSVPKEEQDSYCDPGLIEQPTGTVKEPIRLSSEEPAEDVHASVNAEKNQIVPYHTQAGTDASDPSDRDAPLPKYAPSTSSTKVLPSVGTFTVQCALCFKWRLIPTKEKYEEIRAHIMEEPFTCKTANIWRDGISCNDPADINQDGSRLWAIDKPSIAQPPPGWQRLLRIRGEGSTKFADVYYVTPTGKRLRSMVEVEKHLQEHQEYIEAGVNMSQFSFQIPRPLQENYVRKRPHSRLTAQYGTDLGQRSLEPAYVNPLSWAAPTDCTDLSISQPQTADPYYEKSLSPSVAPRPKKQKIKSLKKRTYGNLVENQDRPQASDVVYEL